MEPTTTVPARSTREVVIQTPGLQPATARATISLTVDASKQYVSRRMYGLMPSLSTLPSRSDEVTRELGLDVYERMAVDGEIAAGLDLLCSAATVAPLVISPWVGSDHIDFPIAEKIAGYFNWMFSLSKTSPRVWGKAMIREALAYGNGVGEILFDIQQDGPWKGFLKVKDISYLSINDQLFVVDNYNNVIGLLPVKQLHMTQPAGAFFPLSQTGDNSKSLESVIPREKFIVLTWEPRSGDPRGQSQLRKVYTPWYMKQQTLDLMLVWLKKFAIPSYWGTVPENAQPICYIDPTTGAEITIKPTEELLQAMQQLGNAAVVALPHGSQLNQFVASQGGQVFLDVLSWADRQITRGLLMQHMATSDSEHMSRSSSATHQDVLSLFIVQLRMLLADQIRQDILIPLTRANFGAEYEHLAPRADFGDGDGFPITPNEVAQLMNAGYFTTDQMPTLDRIIGVPVRRVEETGVRPYNAAPEATGTIPAPLTEGLDEAI